MLVFEPLDPALDDTVGVRSAVAGRDHDNHRSQQGLDPYSGILNHPAPREFAKPLSVTVQSDDNALAIRVVIPHDLNLFFVSQGISHEVISY